MMFLAQLSKPMIRIKYARSIRVRNIAAMDTKQK
jgi:hypothetical protein